MNRVMTRGMAAVMLVGVAACTRPAPPAPTPAPRPVTIIPAPAPRPMPMPPNSSAPDLIIPATDATGRRMTINVDLSPEQALWQLRIGLNVAALNCRGPNDQILIDNYTRFLNNNRRPIAAAERWVIADQGRRNGTNGIAARDALSTKLYNYFAQPPVLPTFCERATAITAMAAAEPTASILTFASTQLALLDQPFVDFYAAYDRYRADYAAWYAAQPAAPTPVAAPPAAPAGAVAGPTAPRPAGSTGG